MGAKERNKGKRVELELVHLFQKDGHIAGRVPHSGAGREKGDVRVDVPGSRYGDAWFEARFWYYEVKARAYEFNSIYTMYTLNTDSIDAVLKIKSGRQTCYLSYNYKLLYPFASEIKHTHELDIDKENVASTHPVLRVLKMRKWLGKCEALVLKGDRKQFLFIHYANTSTDQDIGQDVQS